MFSYVNTNGHMAIVYKVTSPENKIYVGTTIRTLQLRINEHKCFSKKASYNLLHKDMRKFGFDQFRFETLEKCSDANRFERESFWISKLESYKSGYNKSMGGSGPSGFCPTKQQRKNAKQMCIERMKDPKFVKKFRAITQNSEVQRTKGIKGAYARMMAQPLISVYENGKYLGDFRTGTALAEKLGVDKSTGQRYLSGKSGRGRFVLVRKVG